MKGGATKIVRRERYKDRNSLDRKADAGFLAALWAHFGEEPFERGNLDAGRLSWLFGREVVAAEDPFDPTSYDAMLKIRPPWRNPWRPAGRPGRHWWWGLSSHTRRARRRRSAIVSDGS